MWLIHESRNRAEMLCKALGAPGPRGQESADRGRARRRATWEEDTPASPFYGGGTGGGQNRYLPCVEPRSMTVSGDPTPLV